MKYLHTYYNERSIKDHPFEIDQSKHYHTIVVIPAHDESLEILEKTMKSLLMNKQTAHQYLCLILINHRASDSDQIADASASLFKQLKARYQDVPAWIDIQIRYQVFDQKKAGVGLARKILMDAAFEYYYKQERNGIIINLDADTTVESNYFNAIVEGFTKNGDVDAYSLHFEHTVTIPTDVYKEAAIKYELHLRYFINMQRLIQLPYAYQTIGSAMATRSDAYAKVGGMNKRQAGEDFYFLHKYSQLGTLKDLNSTTVYPSCRLSDRVPFGTGKAIQDITTQKEKTYTSYNPESFILIRKWIVEVFEKYKSSGTFNEMNDSPIQDYLKFRKMDNDLQQILDNTSSFHAFRKRFFQWFGPFELMKCLHFLRENNYPNQPIEHCTEAFYKFIEIKPPKSLYDILMWFRSYDKKQDYYEISKNYY